jgi:hypothetical protein
MTSKRTLSESVKLFNASRSHNSNPFDACFRSGNIEWKSVISVENIVDSPKKIEHASDSVKLNGFVGL